MVVRKATLVTALLFVPLVGGMLTSIALTIRPISDKSLTAWFFKHRNEWERLMSVVHNDPRVTIVQRHSQSSRLLIGTDKAGRTISMSEMGSSAGELLRLFDVLGCDYVSRSALETKAALRRNGIEDLYPGGYKVIAICSNQPPVVVSSIDDFRQQNPGKYRYYQHLDGPWYIKYEQAH